ncbi:hypothetical protein ACTWQB_09355 [Piscibacillus sp. B03]|uniref:hypothetical protein n=1 Tax=Piscibacillus sp. B03 TaxID=3457430 RepID=UPI003FCC4EC5
MQQVTVKYIDSDKHETLLNGILLPGEQVMILNAKPYAFGVSEYSWKEGDVCTIVEDDFEVVGEAWFESEAIDFEAYKTICAKVKMTLDPHITRQQD